MNNNNFISAVVYINNNAEQINKFLTNINLILKENFTRYEIICVNDASTDETENAIHEFAKTLDDEIVILVNMSYFQGLELSMSAGVDLAIGDFVYEFDSIKQDYDKNIILKIYEKCLEGYDIVSATSNKNQNKISSVFYEIFNRYSNMQYKIHSETFRILSRRAINRIYSTSKNILYRKAIYASCGLKMINLIYKPTQKIKNKFNKESNKKRTETGINSLILFTNIGAKFSISMSILMILITILVAIYASVIFINKSPVQGWTTIMLFLSLAFGVLFILMTIIIKYLEIIIKIVFREKKYTVESVNKLN